MAICTGTVGELPETPIASRDNPIEHVITVQKLRENWDCPFAYVLCSLPRLAEEWGLPGRVGLSCPP